MALCQQSVRAVTPGGTEITCCFHEESFALGSLPSTNTTVRDAVVQLTTGENHKVWLLGIPNASDQVNREWVGLALRQTFSPGHQ